MAQGDLTIQIGATDFVSGMTSSPELFDGGFSPETDGVNLIAQPGVLHAPDAISNKSTNLTGEAIAWCPSDVLSSNGYILANDGKVLSVDTSQALTSSSALTGSFTSGTSDISQFIDKIYITSTTDVARMNTDLTSLDSTWWSVTLGKGVLTSGVRHPMLYFIGYLWVADNNALHQIISSSSGSKNKLLLNASNQITALGLDSSNSQMLIATTQGSNYSGTISTGNKIFVYDGVADTPQREVNVDFTVTAFINHGGMTIVACGRKIGYWNGSGITFMQESSNITLSGSELLYKHHLCVYENTLYAIDGSQVMAYGEVLPMSKKVWYYAFKNTINSNKFSLICPVGNDYLGVGFTTNKFYVFPTKTITNIGGSYTFYTKKYFLDDRYSIRKIRVKFKSSVAASSFNQIGILTIYGENGSTFTKTINCNPNKTTFEVNEYPTFSPEQTMSRFQISWNFSPTTSTDVHGIERITVYLTKAE